MLYMEKLNLYRTIQFLGICFFFYIIYRKSIMQPHARTLATISTGRLDEIISSSENNSIKKDHFEKNNYEILGNYENTYIPKLESSSKHVILSLKELMKGPYIMSQDNPKLIEHIQHTISPPSEEPYNLDHPQIEDPSRGQSEEIKNILGEMRNGFFVECGALWGEQSSNTLMFERKYGWSGLLVEAKPKFYDRLILKHRKAWSIHACLSRKPYPNSVLFPRDGKDCCGKISDLSVSSKKKGYVEVQCLPVYTILMALNTTIIDYFSLDVEGHELDILRTIPWDKINIRTLTVEHSNIREGKEPLRHYMKSQGYLIYNPVSKLKHLQGDTIFYKKDIIPKIKGHHM